MSLQDLIAASDAQNGLTAAYQAEYDRLVAGRIALEAAAQDVRGQVPVMMRFAATVDPGASEVSGPGGSYGTIAGAIADAPAGSFIDLAVPRGAILTMPAVVTLHAQTVRLRAVGTGAAPILRPMVYLTSTQTNAITHFHALGGGGLILDRMRTELPTAAADAGRVWSSNNTLMRYGDLPTAVALHQAVVTGGVPGAGLGITSANGGQHTDLTLLDATLDGPIFGVAYAGNGTSRIGTQNGALANGAALHQGGVVGENVVLSIYSGS
ncbi:MAG: hypothetical protein ACU0CO_15025 [Shimia sp.]